LSCPSSPEIFQGNNREWTTKDITQKRDINQYNEGGHFWCSLRPWGNEEDRLTGEKKVRDFIWQHWMEKKRGYIKLSCASVDTSNTYHYFIEPDKNGNWSVVIRVIFQNSNETFGRVDNVTSIERVEDTREKGDWRLNFKTNDDKIVNRLPIF